MAEPLATAPGRIPAPPGGATAAGPVDADAPRRVTITRRPAIVTTPPDLVDPTASPLHLSGGVDGNRWGRRNRRQD